MGVLVVALVTVVAIRQAQDAHIQDLRATPPGTSLADGARVVGGVGPPPGTDVPTYIDARRQALAAVVDNRVAVVSLKAYVPEADVRALAAGAEVLALLAAVPGGVPAVVEGRVAAWVGEQQKEAEVERDELRRLLPTVTDAEFVAEYKADIARLERLLSVVRPDGALVFGLVVRAPAGKLMELGRSDKVRLVDVGPSAAEASSGRAPSYRGLRPEEVSRAVEPATRPL